MMKIEIWSDVVCPFCYIGKRNFEAALKQFKDRKNIDFIWKSFQLAPDTENNSPDTIYEYLAKRKGITVNQAMQMYQQVTDTAQNAGLNFNFENAKVANTLKAHCLLHLAKENNLGDKVKERLLLAYFIQGEDIGSDSFLISVGEEVGLSSDLVKNAIESDKYKKYVNEDIQEGQNLGISGVPFFVLDRKYGISGAQPVEHMLATIEKAYIEWNESQTKTTLEMSKGDSCGIDNKCE